MKINRRSTPLRRLALLAPLAVLACGATAQQGTLDPGVVSSNNLDAGAVSAIEQHASTWAPQLADADASTASNARDRLTQPLTSSSASVAFRLAYSGVLTPQLTGLAASPEIGARLGALRVAGMLATDESSAIVLGAMTDDEPSVRLFAAAQLGETLAASRTGAPALTPEGADEIVRALGEMIASADSPLEAAAAVRALAVGTRIEQRGFDAVRNLAASQLGARTGERVRRLGADSADELEIIVALEACAAGRTAVTAATSRPDANATTQIIGMGADVMAWALSRWVGKHMPPVGERGLESQAVGAAENVIYFARQHAARLKGQSPASNPPRIAQSLRDGDDRAFRTAALALLGSDGDLVREFAFKADRFTNRAP